MKKWLGFLSTVFIVVGLAACGGADNTSDSGETAEMDPEAIVQKSCVSCHGENLEGRGPAPALNQIGAELTEEQILDAIQNGRSGMPANIIEGEKAEKVAAWLAEKK